MLSHEGLPAEVLRLSWPHGVAPLELSNFETQARRLRYQSLGMACLRSNIRTLLLAHHEDDQAETILSRIAAGKIGRGLRGVKAEAGIPECHGLFGVDQGGEEIEEDDNGADEGRPTLPFNRVAGISSSGVQILRPLLDFSKEALLATCIRSNVPWFHDKTNDDPTLTLRNTLRHLLKGGHLPQALRKDRMLELSKRVEISLQRHQQDAEQTFSRLGVKALDLRSGRLIIELPDLSHTFSCDHHSPGAFPQHTSLLSLRVLLTHLARTVSPQRDVLGQTLNKITERVINSSVGNTASRRRFTGGGIEWTPISQQIEAKRGEGFRYYHDRLWSLSRELPRRDSLLPLCLWQSSHSTAPQVGTENCPLPFGTWQLFDGRFWLRVWDSSQSEVCARFPRETELNEFLKSLPERFRNGLQRTLKQSAPHKSRRTLTALASPGNGPLLALPTFNAQLPETRGFLKWQVLYKRISQDHDTKDYCLVPGADAIDN